MPKGTTAPASANGATKQEKGGARGGSSAAPRNYVQLPAALLHPEHQARMGPALWVFLWLWREAGLQEGEWAGEVRGGRAIRLEEIAGDLGIPERTVKRHIASLREAEYLETWSAGHGGLEFMVFLWDPEKEKGGSEAKNGPGGIIPHGLKMAPEDPESKSQGPNLALEGIDQAAQGPKMAPEHPPRPPHKELYISRERSLSSEGSHVSVSNVPAATERFNTTASVETETAGAGPGSPVAGDRAESPGLIRARQLLDRVEAWERPELTRTLQNKLGRLDPCQVEQAFEFVWRRHRHRNKGLDSPAAWWASMLARAADELARAGPG